MYKDVAEGVWHDGDPPALPVDVPEGGAVAVLDHHLRVQRGAARAPHAVLERLVLLAKNKTISLGT